MSALSSLVALPLVTVPAPSIAAPERFSSDEEILQITEEIFALKPRYAAAMEAHHVCEDESARRTPEWPDDLLWGVMSPVSYDGSLQRNGKRYLKCNLHQVECLRDQPPMVWTFIGAAGEESHGDHFDDMRYPLPEFAHLYEGHPDKRRQVIAERMIAALDRWERERDQLRSELRCDEMCERFEQISEQMGELVERLESLRADSIEALRAKAAVLAQHLMEWDHEPQIDQSSGFDLAKSLIDDLGGTLPFTTSTKGALPLVPPSSRQLDPVFDVIRSEKRAWDDFVAYLEGDQKDRLQEREIELSDLQDDAANEVYHTRPQTRAGHGALIDHVIRMIKLDCSGRIDEDSFYLTGSQLIALLQNLRISDGLV